MDKCREEFEEWFLKHKENEAFEADLSKTNGRYNYTRTLNLWIGWKASRDSMKVIKLPQLPTGQWSMYKQSRTDAINECKDAITSAGHKVEE